MRCECNQSDDAFGAVVRQLQKAIRTGEIFQVVPSRRFSLPCPSPLAAYYVLKKSNPSPYMFFMQDNDFTLFGASPESSLKYDAASRQIEIYPIAGTRPRGRRADGTLDRDLDSRIELDMRTDHKELSEHLMLVDLARNDLARICTPGSRYVADLTKVDRYSYVMHLVSRVVGELRHDLDALHAYRACMNMGTLSGAPKVRAMQLIADAEGQRRGAMAARSVTSPPTAIWTPVLLSAPRWWKTVSPPYRRAPELYWTRFRSLKPMKPVIKRAPYCVLSPPRIMHRRPSDG